MTKQWYSPESGVAPEVGQWLHGWQKTSNKGKTGWVWDGSTWVQMREGEPTGQTQKNPENTNLLGKTANSLKKAFGFNRGKLKAGDKNRGVFGWRSLVDYTLRDATDLDNMGPSGGLGTSLLGSVANQTDSSKSSRKNKLKFKDLPNLSQGAKDAQAMARARIEAGKSTLGDFGSGENRGMLAAQYAAKNKKKLKFTKEQKKWLKANPSGTFINEDGIDQAYSPEFDLIRFNQAKKHKQWLIDHGRV